MKTATTCSPESMNRGWKRDMDARFYPCKVPVGGLLLLFIAFAVGPLTPRAAYAQWGWCDSDPVVSLSNMTQIDMSARINDDLSDVRQVVYVLHIPVGISVISIVNTDGLMGIKESVRIFADEPASAYASVTTVYTGHDQMAVTASTSVVGVPTSGTASASGSSGHPLTISFSTVI